MGKQERKYRIGRHHQLKARKYVWLGILITLLILVGVVTAFIAKAVSESDTEISMPAPITREYAPPQASSKQFDQTEFTISLPQDWRLKGHESTPNHNVYSFQATEKNKDNRWLEVHVDKIPEQKAFNRLLPVIVESNRIVVISSVSDNCTAFTGSQGANRPSETGETELPAKWQGVSFLCDMASYSRNVVGVASQADGHKLQITGEKTGTHTFYFVYTDHNINPDYQILERALESLIAK